MSKDTLIVSEAFKSIQGEGQTVGRSCYFIRLAACNISCGISSMDLTKAKKENWDQDKIKRNQLAQATWTCDSIAQWMKGKKMTWPDLEIFLNTKSEQGLFIEDLEQGAHVIFTGGEPLLQQEAISFFIKNIKSRMKRRPIIEIETNATIVPSEDMLKNVSFWNLSPKLANSGMPEKKRIVADSLKVFSLLDQVMFKFVVKSEEDVNEIMQDYVIPFNIHRYNIKLMPACDTRDEYIETAPKVAEIVKKYNLCMSPREHVIIWDKRVGV